MRTTIAFLRKAHEELLQADRVDGEAPAGDSRGRCSTRASRPALGEPTPHEYLRALRRLLVIEDHESWKPRLRSRIEVDGIVEARDGRWIGAEIKLGTHRIDEGTASLLAVRDKLDDTRLRARCGTPLVDVADSPTHSRPDGVYVGCVAALGP